MYRVKHTEVWPERTTDIFALRMLVGRLIPHLSWRRHGIGVLQAYIHEAEYNELRVHIWHPRLVLPGIAYSGVGHNHRFTLESTVLAGQIVHTEWNQSRSDENGDHVLYTFPHARIQTDDTKTLMVRANDIRYSVDKIDMLIKTGVSYRFEIGCYHSTEVDSLAVTLVKKLSQTEKPARVIAPINIPPVPAFSGPELTDSELSLYLEMATVALIRSE